MARRRAGGQENDRSANGVGHAPTIGALSHFRMPAPWHSRPGRLSRPQHQKRPLAAGLLFSTRNPNSWSRWNASAAHAHCRRGKTFVEGVQRLTEQPAIARVIGWEGVGWGVFVDHGNGQRDCYPVGASREAAEAEARRAQSESRARQRRAALQIVKE